MYLLVVDYYSKFFEVELLSSGYTSSQVIIKFKSIFARHGIPTILISDNGPPFNSKEFSQFCSDWGIDNITSSPYLARSNGLAERSIQTIKNILYKCKETGVDPYIAFLQHRTTPKNDLPSPSELLMSRKLRTKIPTISDVLKPKISNSKQLEKVFKQKQTKSSQNYNKNSKNFKQVEIDEKVYFKKNPESVWYPGKIFRKCKEPRSFLIKDENGVVYRRNRQHIMKTSAKPSTYLKNNDNEKHNVKFDKNDNLYLNFNVSDENPNENLVNNHQNTNVSNNENVHNENLNNEIITNCSNENEMYTSKFGRKIVPPRRLNL